MPTTHDHRRLAIGVAVTLPVAVAAHEHDIRTGERKCNCEERSARGEPIKPRAFSSSPARAASSSRVRTNRSLANAASAEIAATTATTRPAQPTKTFWLILARTTA